MKKSYSRPTPSRQLVANCLVTLASWALAGNAAAALLNLPHPSSSPSLTFAPPSSVVYKSGTSVYLESASPIAIQTNGSDPSTLHYINPTGTTPSETFMISINVDSAGKLKGGDGGDDLLVIGEVDLNGDGVADAAGTLLTGEIIQFGYQNVTTTDRFDFRFRITGGQLANLGIYKVGQDDLYVYVTSETSTFTGSFATDFNGQAKGSVWATPTTAIGDTVWQDANGNGIQDGGETGVAGVTVQLASCTGTPLASTLTDSNGHYLFSGLVPGDYTVQVTTPTGYVVSAQDQGGDDLLDSDADTAGLMACTTLTSGETDTSWDAGLVPEITIGDRVWNDANGNGVQDGGENGISGVTVQLLDCAGTLVQSTTTDASGLYGFTVPAGGKYQVKVQIPAGFTAGPALQGGNASQDSDIDATGLVACATYLTSTQDVDAGLIPDITIGDRVWNDANGNGIQDGGESGISGVTVQLLDCAGTLVQSTTTDASGLYGFTVPAGGKYQVKVQIPAGFTAGPALQGGNASQDSDIDATGLVACATYLASTQDVDAGVYQPAAIGDRVWHDLNGDGVQDSGEPGLSGWSVAITAPGGYSATTGTDANGNYTFPDLKAGQYTVCVTPMPGFTATYDLDGLSSANCATATIAAGDNRIDVDFGYLLSKPAIAIVKKTNGADAPTGSGPFIQVGSAVNWTYDVTNIGNVMLTNVAVTDSKGVAVVCPQATLAVGAAMTCAGSGSATLGQYENIGYAQGVDPNAVVVTSQYPSHYYGYQTTGCTYTQGYWKNHADKWPLSSLPLGAVTYSQEQLLSIFQAPVKGNGLISLAHQLIAAKLNLASGASSPPQVQDAISIAEALIGGVSVPPVGSGYLDPAITSPVAATLDTFNTGMADGGPSHCGDQPPVLCSGTIGDLVWEDTNHDGVQDSGEMGLASVKVTLAGVDAYGMSINTSVLSTATGSYRFSNLCAGSYTLTSATPAGEKATTPLSANGNDGSATDSNNPAGTSVTLGSDATENSTVDFGFVPKTGAVTLKKYTNGQDADTAPGPEILVGAAVNWTYVVSNSGDGTLTGVTVQDDQGVVVTCPQATLDPGASMTCTGSGVATAGQYQNIGTVTANFNNTPYTAQDPSHYFGYQPKIDVEKYVSVDGGTTWIDADSPTGADVPSANICTDGGSAPTCTACAGGVTSLTLAYQGSKAETVKISDANGVILFQGLVKPGQEITFSGKAFNKTMTDAVSVFIGCKYHTSFQTGCALPIGPGLVRGDFAVVAGKSLNGGTLCGVTCQTPPTPDCKPCTDKVDELTLEYQGASRDGLGGDRGHRDQLPSTHSYVRVFDKENRELLPKTLLKIGQRITLHGKDSWGTLTDEVKIYVNNAYHCSFNTSTAEPIGPGRSKGSFKVISGKSHHGDELCPISDDGTGYTTPENICAYTPPASACQSDQVRFTISLANTGNVPLSALTLTDTPNGLGSCTVPASLAPGAVYVCQVGPVAAQTGVHTNTAVATGSYNGTTVSDTDSASYIGQAPQCGLAITKTASQTSVPKAAFADGGCFDHEGYDKDGYDGNGYDREGYDRDGFTMSGRCRKGHSKAEHGKYGHDKDGYDLDGCDREGYDRSGYDRQGYDKEGYGREGFNRDGQCRSGHSKAYHQFHGHNAHGYDLDGFNASGYDKDGYDRHGCDHNGYDREGYDRQGWSRDGHDRLGHDRSEHDQGCTPPADTCPTDNKVTYTYTVTNTGAAKTNVVVSDDKLGFVGKIPTLATGKSVTLTKSACITDTTTNVATVTVEGDGSCAAMAQATVEAICTDADGGHHTSGNLDGNGCYDRDGYSIDGYDRDGYNKSGRDKDGYDRDGYNGGGTDRSGCTLSGWSYSAH